MKQPCKRTGVRLSIVYFLLLYILVFFTRTVVLSRPNNEKHRPYKVMIINSYHQGFRWTDDIVQSVMRTIKKSMPDTEFFVEYMDTKRVYNEKLIQSIRRNFSVKYVSQKIDVIITSDDNALNFVERFHEKLFSAIPVVFCGVNNINKAREVPCEYFTGITESQDIISNVHLAANMFPSTKRIIVVTDGTPTGLGTRREVKVSEKLFKDLTFVYLNGEDLSTTMLLEHLRSLKKNDIVLAPAWYRDKDGVYYNNTEIYPLMSRNSPVPILGPSAANLGFGILGGKVNSGEIQGQYAANMAVSILAGENTTETIPVMFEGQNAYMFDGRQLIRFGIDEKTLPKGSIVVNRPFSFYAEYKTLVWSVVILFCVFTSMIIALILNIKRLRKTRQILTESEERYKAVVEDIPVLICRFLPAGDILFVNKTYCDYFQKKQNELIGANFYQFIPESERDASIAAVSELSAEHPTNIHEHRVLLRDGRIRWQRWTHRAMCDENGSPVVYQSIGEDITEQKLAEEKLRTSLKEKEILLREVHHRVKNTMQVIIAMLNLQIMRDNKNKDDINLIINSIISRIQIFADIHQSLYKYDNLSQIDFVSHLKANFNNLKKMYKPESGQIQLDMNIDSAVFGLDIAVPCGLLMNELMTNSFKHALSNSGKIYIEIRHNQDDAIEKIVYSDSGSPGEYSTEGFGSTIIHAMSIQLELQHEIVRQKTLQHIFINKHTQQHWQKKTGKILFIEDEVIIAMEKINKLRKAGYSVDENIITSGEKAIEYINNLPVKPSLLVMDVRLTGDLDGIETVTIIRKENIVLPVIFITGYENKEIIEKIKHLSSAYYLPKTCSGAEFLEKVNEALE